MITSPFSLVGKKILVTGASSGFGAAIAKQCSEFGASVILTARNKSRLEISYCELTGTGHSYQTCDLLNDNDLDDFVKKMPIVDGIVLSAGITEILPVKFINKKSISKLFQVNTFSSFLLLQKILEAKLINKGGSIIFISSISTHHVDVGNSLYSASIGAINSFAKVLALETAKMKIRVNCVEPGFVKTNFLENSPISIEDLKKEEALYPLGFGLPSDIANGVIYLLSDASQWVTGSVLTIDGGITLK